MKILFRADGNQEIGMGHLTRLMTLASFFEEKQVGCYFLLGAHDKQALDWVASKYPTFTVDEPFHLENHLAVTRECIEKNSITHVFIDLSHDRMMRRLDDYHMYITALASENVKLVMIDGLEHDCLSLRKTNPAHIVLIPYFGALSRHFHTDNHTRLLAGPEFFVLRQEFNRSAFRKKTIGSELNRAVISMGGSDPSGLTVHAMKSMVASKLSEVQCTVTVGPAFSDELQEMIRTISKSAEGLFHLVFNAKNMSQILFESDLALVTGGLTKYEAAAMGTPAIILSRNREESAINDEFVRAGTAEHVADTSTDDYKKVAGMIQKMKDDFLRRKMSMKGRALVDGQALKRLYQAISEERVMV